MRGVTSGYKCELCLEDNLLSSNKKQHKESCLGSLLWIECVDIHKHSPYVKIGVTLNTTIKQIQDTIIKKTKTNNFNLYHKSTILNDENKTIANYSKSIPKKLYVIFPNSSTQNDNINIITNINFIDPISYHVGFKGSIRFNLKLSILQLKIHIIDELMKANSHINNTERLDSRISLKSVNNHFEFVDNSKTLAEYGFTDIQLINVEISKFNGDSILELYKQKDILSELYSNSMLTYKFIINTRMVNNPLINRSIECESNWTIRKLKSYCCDFIDVDSYLVYYKNSPLRNESKPIISTYNVQQGFDIYLLKPYKEGLRNGDITINIYNERVLATFQVRVNFFNDGITTLTDLIKKHPMYSLYLNNKFDIVATHINFKFNDISKALKDYGIRSGDTFNAVGDFILKPNNNNNQAVVLKDVTVQAQVVVPQNNNMNIINKRKPVSNDNSDKNDKKSKE